MNTSTISSTAEQAKNSFEYSDWKEKLARVGHAAKGAVYGVAGVLTFMAAFNMGGQKAGKLQVIDFLQNQPFGQILVALMGVGLACYAFFRFIQVGGKSEQLQQKSEGKRKVLKAGYLVSGLIYLALAVYAIMQVLGSVGSGGSGKGSLQQLLSNDWGAALFYVAAGLLLIKAIYQFVKVAKNDYYEDVRGVGEIGVDKATEIVKKAGAWGFISRGVLIAITAFFFYKAASQQDASEIQGSSGAFAFLQDMTAGPWLMGAVAFGLICYSVYMIVVSRYKTFHIK